MMLKTQTAPQTKFLAWPVKLGLALGFLALFYLIDLYIVSYTDLNNVDFSYFWAGGRAITKGYSPYDHAALTTIYQEMGHNRVDSAIGFPYPLWFVLPFIPLSLLPYTFAIALWALCNQILYVIAFLAIKRLMFRVRPTSRLSRIRRERFLLMWGLLLFVLTPHFVHSLLNGQNSFLMTALLALFAYWFVQLPSSPVASSRFALFRSGPELWSGFFLASLIVKPPLVIVIGPLLALWLWRRRAWQSLAIAVLVGLVVTGLAFAIYPGWLSGWLSSRTTPGEDTLNTSNLWALSHDLTDWLGQPGLALALGVFLVGVWGAANLLVLWRRPAPLLGLLAIYTFGLGTTFYNHNYDMLILFLPYLVLLDWSLDLPRRLRWLTWAALTFIVFVLPWRFNLQAISSPSAALYTLLMNLFLLVFIGLVYPRRAKAHLAETPKDLDSLAHKEPSIEVS